jgi:phosphoribosylanthranilate isomerase
MIIKVCGVRTAQIAEVAIEAGADWLGLVLVPASPRHVDETVARPVIAAARGRAQLVGVMVSPTAADCDDAARRFRLDAVQVHGRADPSLANGCSVPVIRGINVHPGTAAYTDSWWPDCLLLLDAAPGSEGDLPGGTGARVDEETAAAVARHRPVILAGGLHADNVAAAIAAVRPRGVDASSGLESSPGVKDPERVGAYVRAARAAFSGGARR